MAPEMCRQLNFTSVGHGRLNDVQCRVVFTQVIGHVPIGVDRQQICTTVEQGVENKSTKMVKHSYKDVDDTRESKVLLLIFFNSNLD